MRILIAGLTFAVAAGVPAFAEEPSGTKPACLRAKSVNGWASGNERIVRLDTAGKRWRVTFKEPCLGRDKPLKMAFGLRVGTTCVEPGDELIFVTVGGYEQSCFVEKVEQMKLGEKLIPDEAATQPPP
jgi:hypothetical protein